MEAPYAIVDVFAERPLEGNALAVFHEPGTVDPAHMQRIAREMNLSETTFVTGIDQHGYDVRIFTPDSEMPVAGHPTLGTAWVLRHLGALSTDAPIQRSPVGETQVRFGTRDVWFERTGSVVADVSADEVARGLGASPADVGCEISSIDGMPVTLRPAIADAGFPTLLLPMRSAGTIASLRATGVLAGHQEVYCFAPAGPGAIKARFFAPGVGIAEDPATGIAAAALGIFLGERAGALDVTIEQGVEVGRPSKIMVRAHPGRVEVGGWVHLVGEGKLTAA